MRTRIGYISQLRWRLAKHGEQAQISDLHRLNDLETAFNQDIGKPRLILLFSPT